ncbi:MAG TPA: cell division protein FtsW, partial [Rhizobiales bacterium]|nr:cell division protein FtsW [Hyphomicrobiales bacterium]
VSLWAFAGSLALMAAAILFGPEIKGAHRWLDLGPVNLQPSELAKPAFIVAAAWFLAEGRRKPDIPGQLFAWGSFALFAGLLVVQPDFGQTALVCMVWAVMLLVYGIRWRYVFGLAGMGMAGAVAAYEMIPHVASRVDRFLSPGKGDTFQVDTAMRAFENGGLWGTGPGGGAAKLSLPDAHTDFIFAVIGEEFGLIACMVLIALVAFVALRVLRLAMAEADSFVALALTGLVSVFSFQAIINMAVNVSLMPAKGMTLPFISYGGSSLIAMAFAMGLVMALTRTRPGGHSVSPSLTAHLA